MFLPPSRRDWVRGAGIGLATALLGCWILGLTDRTAWETPTAYGIDGLETLARIKLCADEGWGPWAGRRIQSLGAPFGADWSAYPQPDFAVYWLVGQLSHVIGLMPAANAALVGALTLAAVAFYACSRALGHRPIAATIGALLFGLSYHNFHRGLSHYSFALSFVVPLLLYLCWRSSASRPPGTRWTIVASLLSVLIAAANPYFVLIYLELLALTLGYLLVTRQPWKVVRTGCILGLVTILSFIAWNAVPLLLSPGAPEAIARNYGGAEIYALKPIDLLLPSGTHRWDWLAHQGTRYVSATTLRGELLGQYLGLIPLAALAWLALLSLHRLAQGRAGLKPAHAPMVLWILAAAGVGGFHAAVAFWLNPVFRAGNRYSVVILAIALFFLGSVLSRAAWFRRRPLALAAAAAAVLLGLWDQTPPGRAAQIEATAAILKSDREFAERLEQSLPAGAMIFQLPAVAFPEQPPVEKMTDYALFRPFLHARSLRFSYGSLIGSRELRWSRWLAAQPAPVLIAALREAGFHAIYLNRSAFRDQGRSVLSALQETGLPAIGALDESQEHVALKIEPVAAPHPPSLQDPRLFDTWQPGPAPAHQPTVHAIAGWHGVEQAGGLSWRWGSAKEMSLGIWSPDTTTADAVLLFDYSAKRPGRVTIKLGDKIMWVGDADRTLRPAEVRLPLPPGGSQLMWTFSGHIANASLTDPRPISVRVVGLRLE